MNFEYHIIDTSYNKVKVFEYEEDALTYVEQHRQYTYVKELKYDVKHLEFLYSLE